MSLRFVGKEGQVIINHGHRRTVEEHVWVVEFLHPGCFLLDLWGVPDATSLFLDYVTLQGLFLGWIQFSLQVEQPISMKNE